MTSLRADKIVFGLGLTVTCIFLMINLYSAIKETEREVNCWTPSEFTAAHVEYTNHICEYEEHRRLSLNNTGYTKNYINNFCSLTYYGVQAVLLLISYYLLSSITTSIAPSGVAVRTFTSKQRKDLDSKESLLLCEEDVAAERAASCTIIMSYLLTQVITAIFLIGLSVRSLAEFSTIHQEPEKNHTFYCDFEINRFGMIRKYTVQCVEDEEAGGSISVVAKGLPYMNTILCLVLAVMIIIHIITMVSCGSRARRQIQRVLTEKQLMDSEAFSFNGGCISDMTLITAVANENPNWSGG